MFWSLLSLSAGIVLGWWHFRRCEGMVVAMLGRSEDAPFRRLVLMAGMARHIFTLGAGVLLVRVAAVHPFHLAGGLLIATFAYRVHAVRRRLSGIEGVEILV